jgi:hypothetical protein
MFGKDRRPEDLIADLQSLASVAREQFQLQNMPLKNIHIVDTNTLYECLQRTPLSEEARTMLGTLIFGFLTEALKQNLVDRPTTPRPHNIKNIEVLQRPERRGKLIAAPVGKDNELRLTDFVWLGEATGHVELNEYLRTNIILLVLAMLDGAFEQFIKNK